MKNNDNNKRGGNITKQNVFKTKHITITSERTATFFLVFTSNYNKMNTNNICNNNLQQKRYNMK